jgi:hypothetical protein
MNLYDNICNVLRENLSKFEMNLMNMEYSKRLLKHCNQCFLLFKNFVNDLKKIF